MSRTLLCCTMLLLTTVAASTAARADWRWISGECRKVVMTGEQTAVAVGVGGKIMRSDDAGATWRFGHSGVRQTLLGVVFADVQRGYAVGQQGTILATSDGGTTWTALESPVEVSLLDITGTAAGTLIAVGAEGTVLRSDDGGATWQQKYSHEFLTLNAVHFGDDGVGMAVGNNGMMIRTTDDGQTWTRLDVPVQHALLGVRLRGSFGLVVGGGGTVLRTTDAGVTWTAVNSGLTTPLLAVALLDNRTAVAVGARAAVVRTTDDGQTWTPMSLADRLAVSTSLTGVSFYGQQGIVVGSEQVVLTSGSGGTEWSIRSHCRLLVPPAVNTAMADLRFLDAERAIMCGEKGEIYASSDGGATWLRRESGTPLNLRRIHVGDNGRLTIYGSFGAVVTSEDSGETWQYTSGFGNANIIDAVFTTTTHGIAVGDSTVWRTVNGGEDWTSQRLPDTDIATGVAFASAMTGFITASKTVQVSPTEWRSEPRVFRTDDGGQTWSAVAVPVQNRLHSVYFYNPSLGFMVGETGAMLRTTDGGETWTVQDSRTTANLAGIGFTDERRGIAVGFSSAVLITDDGGITWQEDRVVKSSVSDTTGTILNRVVAIDSALYVLGSGVVLQHTPTPLQTTVGPVQTQNMNPYLYIMSFPHPARQSSTLKVYGLYSIATGTPLSLYLYNMLGEKIADLSPELNGANNGKWAEFTLNTTAIAPGPYLLYLRAGEASYSTKLFIAR